MHSGEYQCRSVDIYTQTAPADDAMKQQYKDNSITTRPRATKISASFHMDDMTKKPYDNASIFVHEVIEHVAPFKDLLGLFEYVCKGITIVDTPYKFGKNCHVWECADINESSMLKIIHRESNFSMTTHTKRKRAAPSPTLYFLLHSFCVSESQPQVIRMLQSESQTTPLLVRVFTNVIKILIDKHQMDDCCALSRRMNFILEATCSRASHASINSKIRGMLRNWIPGVSSSILILPLFTSQERVRDQRTSATKAVVVANRNAVIIPARNIDAYVRLLKRLTINRFKPEMKGSDFQDGSWMAACVLVELCIGARVCEIIHHSKFMTLSDARASDPVFITDAMRMFPHIEPTTEYSLIVQIGQLKKRSKMQRHAMMTPRPILFGVTSTEICKLVNTIIRPQLLVVLAAKYPTIDTNNYNTIVENVDYNSKTLCVNRFISSSFTCINPPRPITTHDLRRIYVNASFNQSPLRHVMSRNSWISIIFEHAGLSHSLSYTGVIITEQPVDDDE